MNEKTSAAENAGVQQTQNPLVSVIIPCYNAELYVEKAVRSVMEQTYTNLEILITDDCSTDGSFAILQSLAAEDPRIKLFRNETNQKIVRTLNSLVERANGKYIARMDADDISLPKRIEKQAAFMESHAEIAFCGTQAWNVNKAGEKIGMSRIPSNSSDCAFFLPFYSTFYHPTVMFRGAVCKENSYDESFLYAEDYELWCRLLLKKNLRACNLDDKLFEYRIFQNQTSFSHKQRQMELCCKILKSYSVIPDNLFIAHSCLLFGIPCGDFDVRRYLKYFKTITKHRSSNPCFCAYEKILFNSMKFGIRMFLPVLFSKMGILSSIQIILRRLQQEK